MALIPIAARRPPAREIESVLTKITEASPRRFLYSLIASDLVAVACAAALGIRARELLNGVFALRVYFELWPICGLFILTYALLGLYPAVGISAVEELRRTTLATNLVYLLLGTATFFLKWTAAYSRGGFVIAWLFTIGTVPLARSVMRRMLARWPRSLQPVVVFGGGHTGAAVVQLLQRNPQLGLRPVAVLDDDASKRNEIVTVPAPGGFELGPSLAAAEGIPWAILAIPAGAPYTLRGMIRSYAYGYRNLFVIPEVSQTSHPCAASDLKGILGLQVEQSLFRTEARYLKRALDIVLTIGAAGVLIPLFGLIALCIRLDSRGPVFYRQRRIGLDGATLYVWKFRTMVTDAETLLERYLEMRPEMRQEWERDHKLKNDPRITRVGRLLRKTSLDELPQTLNVLTGEMSWVGPRPIVDAEAARYGDMLELYCRTVPGITGLWQVSGRSNTTYEERVALDGYYVRNWSVWLDLHILVRTLTVVLKGVGAY